MAEKSTSTSKIRVLDLSMFWSGPSCTCLLGETGMEVIKIEACHHPDPDRIIPQGLNYLHNEPGEDPWNRGMLHLRRDRNKFAITLNLTKPEGRDIFLNLVKISDVVVENFRVGVLERWQLEYSDLQQVNPNIILVSLTSQGDTGPERHYGSNAEVLACISGTRYITGYTDELAGFRVTTFADPLAGTMAAGFVMAALRYRQHTGKGTHVVISQRELLTSLLGEEIMDYIMNKRVAQPQGNSHPFLAPHGCYQCKGKDSWVTLAVRDDQEWQSLCELMGRPELATHPYYVDGLTRWHHRDEIDKLINEWTTQHERHDLARLLQQRGIPAGAVYQPPDLVKDEHLRSRGFWDTVDDPRPEYGTYTCHGRGFYLSKTPVRTRFRAPDLGEHNSYVFAELLGMSPEEIAHLEEKGIIGTIPTPEVQSTVPSLSQKTKQPPDKGK